MNAETRSKWELILNRALTAALFLLALSAPLSIAATQTAWALALLFWLLRLAMARSSLQASGFDLALLAFVGLTIFSSAFSYEPAVSMRKLVAVSLVTIAYLFSKNVPDKRTIRRLVVVVLASAVVSVIYSLGVLAVGKNLKVTKLASSSPLLMAGIEENDTIIAANGQKIHSPDELADIVDAASPGEVTLWIYHYELQYPRVISGAAVRPEGDNAARFGILEWSRGRDTRASGFFGHYTTYAEALQLLLAVAFALFIVAHGPWSSRGRLVLGVVVVALGTGLFLTVTRASWAGFLLAASVILLIGTSLRTFMICLAIAVPIGIGGLLYLQQKRNVSFFDGTDGSTSWRMTVWHEGGNLLLANARHIAMGVGMDSIKKRHSEWGLFDSGRLPIGHMHSTPLQLALERGLPALIAWVVWMFVYLRLLWKGLRQHSIEWPERGVLLGSFGGTIGFLASGLVHYNWGDSEVVMIFYLLMGLSLAVLSQSDTSDTAVNRLRNVSAVNP